MVLTVAPVLSPRSGFHIDPLPKFRLKTSSTSSPSSAWVYDAEREYLAQAGTSEDRRRNASAAEVATTTPAGTTQNPCQIASRYMSSSRTSIVAHRPEARMSTAASCGRRFAATAKPSALTSAATAWTASVTERSLKLFSSTWASSRAIRGTSKTIAASSAPSRIDSRTVSTSLAAASRARRDGTALRRMGASSRTRVRDGVDRMTEPWHTGSARKLRASARPTGADGADWMPS
jgi:hypothetical protein